MKKVIKKKVKKAEIEEDTTIIIPKSEKIEIGKLTIAFPSEDLNKLVEKINELIDKSNDSI